MNVSPKVGQILTLTDCKEKMMVKSVNEESRTAELMTMTGVPCALSGVSIDDLLPLPHATDSHESNIDRGATAGSKYSLGAESIRDGRPATDDQTIEAIDEERPGATAPVETEGG